MQVDIAFPTDSPINSDKMARLNKAVYDHLESGKTINRYEADKLYGVGNLHSRISDLRNKHSKIIYDKFITVVDRFGEKVKCKEYSLKPYIE